jgi:hypothetical protein
MGRFTVLLRSGSIDARNHPAQASHTIPPAVCYPISVWDLTIKRVILTIVKRNLYDRKNYLCQSSKVGAAVVDHLSNSANPNSASISKLRRTRSSQSSARSGRSATA